MRSDDTSKLDGCSPLRLIRVTASFDRKDACGVAKWGKNGICQIVFMLNDQAYARASTSRTPRNGKQRRQEDFIACILHRRQSVMHQSFGCIPV